MRSYQDPCGIARALDRVGERWALLVVRELLLGPRRFTDLRAGLPSASPNVLSQRLRELEDAGVVQRRALAPPVAATVYELTPRGRELEPVLVSLARWGSRAVPLPQGELSPSALMIALRTTFDPGALARGRLAVVLDGEPFSVEIACGALSVARGEPAAPDATITTTARALRAVVFAGFAGREPRGVEIAGDTALATRFLGAFARPAPA
ncbi:winged helix-turn-helix transcriptional regulator [Sorangium sp. So ce233]|uniref:winged helix-turn-helix transcriptional regulator n=1 Tax=Sorangium sp. So ce233 TaxID=3133290 RepID=UPI003F5FE527